LIPSGALQAEQPVPPSDDTPALPFGITADDAPPPLEDETQLIKRARQAEAKGDLGAALRLQRVAMTLAPDDAAVAFDLARLAMRATGKGGKPEDQDVAPLLRLAPATMEARILRSFLLAERFDSVVVSASNRAERTGSAPATVVVVGAEELRSRGYLALDEVLDDLPGMDIVRPFGSDWYRNYWRGQRTTLGAPYLLLLDGQPLNQLWRNDDTILAALPMSNVERVEVVYGPASAVYGANAALGVVNIITRGDPGRPGIFARMNAGLRGPSASGLDDEAMRRVTDASVIFRGKDLRLSATARLETGQLDPNIGPLFEWTQDRYFADTRLWGDVATNGRLGGTFLSPIDAQALDLRLGMGETELSLVRLRQSTGKGTMYPGDRTQNAPPWTTSELVAGLRHVHHFPESLTATTTLRYRESAVDAPSATLIRDAGTADNPDGAVRFWYSTAMGRSITLAEDLNLVAGRKLLGDDELLIDFGLRFEHKELDKNYTDSGSRSISLDPAVPLAQQGFRWPDPVEPADRMHNRGEDEELGGYALAKYQLAKQHAFFLGGRLDLIEGVEPTFRGGYAGRFFDALSWKLLFGQAIMKPSFRQLYGAGASGSDPSLKPEHSSTLETSLGYTHDWFSAQAGLYGIRSTDIIDLDSRLRTPEERALHRRDVVGSEATARAVLGLGGTRQLKAWANSSHLWLAQQSSPDAPETMRDIGDVARLKVQGGVDLALDRNLSLSLRGRYIGPRATVASNPVGEVPAYATLDAGLQWNNLLAEGLSLNVSVTNLTDARYFHPGVREADSGAGETPGAWQEDGSWSGSLGRYNSLLAQPTRAVFVRLGWDLERTEQ